MKYIKYIDGLRGISILSVLLYHIFPKFFSIGYLGVDIFFVISGYLITSIILSEHSKNQFSICNFYKRRIRRIFPTLILVLSTVLFFSFFVLNQSEYKQLGFHIFASGGFFQNLNLMSEINYFDTESITKPLLHLWSLGIEEQFYILFPCLFIFLKNHNLIRNVLVISFFSSLIIFIILSQINTSINFYLPISRFWQILLGSLLAYSHQYDFKKFNHIVLILIILILLSIIFSIEIVLPLIVCLITIYFINYPKNYLNKYFLSNTIIVYIGKISYPLYIWHWPIISIIHISFINTFIDNSFFMVLMSFILASLTYHFIEVPIKRITLSKVAFINSLSLVIISLIGLSVYINDGYWNLRKKIVNFNLEGETDTESFQEYLTKNYYPCVPEVFNDNALVYKSYKRCKQSLKKANIDIALIGDSHVEHLFIGLADAYPSKNVAYYISNELITLDKEKFKYIFKKIEHEKSIKTIIYTHYYQNKLNDKSINSLKYTVEKLANKKKNIILTDNMPRFEYMARQCINNYPNNKSICELNIAEYNKQKKIYDEILLNLSNNFSNVYYIKISDSVCNNNKCSMFKDRSILFRDKDHLNIEGSIQVGKHLKNKMQKLIVN